jgi:hypothetical protein
MKRFLTGASRAAGPDGLGSMGTWLIAGALALGIAPVSVQAQGMVGSMRMGRVGQPRPPAAAASTYTSPYAMNPYTMGSYVMSPYLSGNPYTYGHSYAPGPSPTTPGTSGAGAGYGGQGYGEAGHGQPGTGQTAPIAAATLFGLPAENGRVQWPLGLRILQPAEETKALREQLELVLYSVATQAAEGRANRTFVDLGLQAVRDLRQLLRPREGTMVAFTYTEATRFLDRTERGLTKVKMMETSPGGAHP